MAPRAAALALAAALCAGCEMGAHDVPPCSPGMPPTAELLAVPAFASLRFHRRVQFDVRRGVGYDLWGDERFDYRNALELELVPTDPARSDDQACVSGISLKLARPPERAAATEKLAALIRAVAPRSGLDAPRLEMRVGQMLAGDAKYQLVEQRGRVSVSAGLVSHPSRGEFFVLSFAWPRP